MSREAGDEFRPDDVASGSNWTRHGLFPLAFFAEKRETSDIAKTFCPLLSPFRLPALFAFFSAMTLARHIR